MTFLGEIVRVDTQARFLGEIVRVDTQARFTMDRAVYMVICYFPSKGSHYNLLEGGVENQVNHGPSNFIKYNTFQYYYF